MTQQEFEEARSSRVANRIATTWLIDHLTHYITHGSADKKELIRGMLLDMIAGDGDKSWRAGKLHIFRIEMKPCDHTIDLMKLFDNAWDLVLTKLGLQNEVINPTLF